MANDKCMRKIRMHTIAKAALITFPSRKYNKLEREIAVKTCLLRFAWEIQDAVEVKVVVEENVDDDMDLEFDMEEED